MIPEKEREALMRLTMCAREECSMCKYKDRCNFDIQCELATKNMNILAEALRKTEPTISKMEQVEDESQTERGDFADRLAYERGVKYAWEVAQKVFNSTVTFYEAEDVARQVDKDINVRSKGEPQTECNSTCEFYDERCLNVECYDCCDGYSRYKPKDELLPKTINGVKIADAVAWADKWLEDNPVSEMWDMIRTLRDATEWQDEPQTNGYQTFNGTSVYVSRLEDEPQTYFDHPCYCCELSWIGLCDEAYTDAYKSCGKIQTERNK